MSAERDAGYEALTRGDAQTAVEQLERASQQDPNDFQAHLYLGAAYGMVNRHNDAVTALTKAVQIQPMNAQARYNLGIALESAGWKEQALTALQQAVQLQPDYPKAQEAIQRLQPGAAPVYPMTPQAPAATPQYPPYQAPQAGGLAGYGQPPAAQPGAYPPPAYGQPNPNQPPQYTPPGYNPMPQQGAAAYGGPPANAYMQPRYGTGPAYENTSGMKSSVPYEVETMGWNWGGCIWGWIWLCAHGMAALGILLLLAGFIPIVGLLTGIGSAIYLGINGYKLAWQNRRFDSVEHLREVENKWKIAAVIWVVFCFLMGILWVVLMASVGSSQPHYP
jgi:hypothetical protein